MFTNLGSGSTELLKTLVALLDDGELDTAGLGERDLGLVALTEEENVADAGGERSVVRVLFFLDK